MTAKHRKGKSNHKHENNFPKNEVIDSEARTGGGSYVLLAVLFLLIVMGACVGAWFCFQQHQTLGQLADSLTGVQMKVVKLQSSHEEMRQSHGKVRRRKPAVAFPHVRTPSESPGFLACVSGAARRISPGRLRPPSLFNLNEYTGKSYFDELKMNPIALL